MWLKSTLCREVAGDADVDTSIAFSRLQSFLAQERTQAIISHDNQQMENYSNDYDDVDENDKMQAPQVKKTRRRKMCIPS